MAVTKIRLCVDQPLGVGQTVPLTREQAHYLFGVMRLGTGAAVALFNGRDGAWQAEVAEAGKRAGVLVCRTQSAPLAVPPDVWLMFAPIKKARTARYFDMPTGAIGELSQPGGPLFAIEHSNGGLISFPGGVPIKNSAGEVIGAIGVSGNTVENDHDVAEAGAAAV